MSIDWNHFTPGSALAGGMLIGLSAALLFTLWGHVAGISSMLAALCEREQGRDHWQVAFIAGLVLAPALWLLLGRDLATGPQIDGFNQWGRLLLAGMLVGLGTRLGNGCTSGHGVCGLSRLSRRSLVAVAVFMGFGGLTVFVLRHVLGG